MRVFKHIETGSTAHLTDSELARFYDNRNPFDWVDITSEVEAWEEQYNDSMSSVGEKDYEC